MSKYKSIDYVQGYTHALIDAKETLRYLFDDLNFYKVRITQNKLDQLFECMINNRTTLRNNPNAFIRYNKDKGLFEMYIEAQEVYDRWLEEYKQQRYIKKTERWRKMLEGKGFKSLDKMTEEEYKEYQKALRNPTRYKRFYFEDDWSDKK